MAQLEVLLNNATTLVFHFSTIRTQSYTVEPMPDPTGLHWECNKVTLDIVGVVNSVTIATNKVAPFSVGPVNKVNRTDPSVNGDTLPFTMSNLQDILRQRLPIKYKVADQYVVQMPRPDANGVLLSCDPRGGPFPQRAQFTEIAGDKSAILSFRVVGYDSGRDDIMLSNSWRMTSDTDNYGMTTRTTTGHACFRMDYLIDAGLEVDDFRNLLFLPVGARMRRVGVTVDVAANGYECDYTVIDKEVVIGLGERSECLEVTGSVTSSIIYPVRDVRGLVNTAFEIGGNALVNPFAVGSHLKALFQSAVPTNVNNGVCRAIGRQYARRDGLARIATGFLLDRLSPLAVGGKTPPVVAAHCTHNIDSEQNPYCEIRLEVLNINPRTIGQVFGVNPENLISTKPDYDVGGKIYRADTTPPKLPAGDNSRGQWLGRLISQALQTAAGGLPDSPPPYQEAKKVPIET